MIEGAREELIARVENLRASRQCVWRDDGFALQLLIDVLEEEISQAESASVMRLVQPRHGRLLGLYPEPLRKEA